jgi:peptidylprolyl isomerase
MFLLLFFSFGFLNGQKLSVAHREILYLRDQRSLGEGKLTAYLRHKDAAVRFEAAIALGNLQDTSTISNLVSALEDSTSKVRASIAFAIGQIGSANAEEKLLFHLSSEQDPSVLSEELDALGKCGSKGGLDSLVAIARQRRKLPRGSVATSIARFAIRGIKSERSIELLFNLLESKNEDTQWRSLYGLWRSSPNDQINTGIANRSNFFSKLSKSSNPDIRINLATLLGRSKGDRSRALLREMRKDERRYNDWRVLVQIVRGFSNHAQTNEDFFADVCELLDHGNEHVQVAGLQSLAGIPTSNMQSSSASQCLPPTMRMLWNRTGSLTVRGEALVVLGKHFPETLRTIVDRSAIRSSDRLYAKYLEALSFSPTKADLMEFFASMDAQDIRVSMAAWEFGSRVFRSQSLQTLQVDSSTRDEFAHKLFNRIKSGLGRHDLGITTLIANAVADSGFIATLLQGGFSEPAIDELIQEFRRLESPRDNQEQTAIIQTLARWKTDRSIGMLDTVLQSVDRKLAVEAATALKAITGKEYSDRISAKPIVEISAYDWKALEGSGPTRAIVQTDRGRVVLRLLKVDARFTVLSFERLVRRGFYNGLRFHRVVPNFVVQGGDPRGDGWGGPEFSIRSEFSQVRYKRGSCGIASSGKDTEGCQFFITHQPTPHLDGRYTIFAEVVEGMDVVDKLQIGSTILSITLRP